MAILNKHQATALNAIVRSTSDIRYHLANVEADAKQVRVNLDQDTNIPLPSISSAISLHQAAGALKWAEHQAREHLEDFGPAVTERLITEARQIGRSSGAPARHSFSVGVEV